MPSLVQLYSSILVPVLTEWIAFDDLFFLDSAVCNRKTRDEFLRTLLKCNVGVEISKDSRNRKCAYEWIALRGLGLKNVFLSAFWDDIHIKSIQTILQRTIRVNSLETCACVQSPSLVN